MLFKKSKNPLVNNLYTKNEEKLKFLTSSTTNTLSNGLTYQSNEKNTIIKNTQ